MRMYCWACVCAAGHAYVLLGMRMYATTLLNPAACRVSGMASHWGHVGVAVLLGWSAALTKEIGITIVSGFPMEFRKWLIINQPLLFV
jgi:hypothetical protein